MALAGMLSILACLLFGLAGAAKFDFVTDLLSKPIRHGYLNGIAVTARHRSSFREALSQRILRRRKADVLVFLCTEFFVDLLFRVTAHVRSETGRSTT